MAEKAAYKDKFMTALKILAVLVLISIILAGAIGLFTGEMDTGNTALIKVEGTISTTGGSLFGDDLAVSEDIVKMIKKADSNPAIKAIIIEIDSPGGSGVASDEISSALKKTNKTTVAVIRDIGASGGYWVASSADHIIANRMSITGSIGVIASYIDFSGLINRYNMTYEQLVAGKYKDIGTPFRQLTPEERKMMQEFLDEVHADFIEEVAANRNMPVEDIRKIADGMFFTGRKAKELGLVDELGGSDEAKAYIENKLNITADIVEYKESKGLSEIFSELIGRQSFSIGEGIGYSLISETRQKGILS
ncbi:signal peptide peptidase SppA [Candidatus Woesearchaeota archaeon CG10_big_fil_rev_8_21_14_0_10_44_13]|nr:MAG: signal peptide peptidase SppA [Candidatus Woesearchaeota archaeon CG10_big_fil_rev_8_21_14_0_10_44_13]